jgi:type II secretory pathway component PulF
VLEFVVQMAFWVVIWLVPNALVLWVVYYLLSLPLRRQERGRFFVDLVESALARGKSVEQEVVELSSTRDRSMGVRFHWLAAYLESGCSLGEALDRVPGFLSGRLRGWLRAGLELGDLGRVLPVCRRVTSDAMSSVQGASNYVVLTFQALSPAAAAVLGLLLVFVFPKYVMIVEEMGAEVPAFMGALIRHSPLVMWCLFGFCAVVYGAAFFYAFGGYVEDWMRRMGWGWMDRVTWCLPWRRLRLERDFMGLRSVLGAGGWGEREAVDLAGRSVSHGVVRAYAREVVGKLGGGCSLVEALGVMDGSGELVWRMRNATASRAGFGRALGGWLEVLDARAYQSQQWLSQVLTTLLVVSNGLLVGFVVVAVFQPLIAVIEVASLW